jgi:peptidoglycan/LPS O-acetylase OafA/YrhL
MATSVAEVDDEFQLGRRPALDGLRGVAVLFVMGTHTGYLWSGVGTWVRGGYIGVDIFFVLSGFLISSLLIEEFDREGHIRLGSFYRRRIFRLFPILYVVMAVTFVYSRLVPALAVQYPMGTEIQGIGAIVIYVPNWLQMYRPGGWALGQVWSLGVEEQFYLLWPLLLIWLLKVNRWRVTAGVIGAMIVLSAASCAYMNHINPVFPFAYLQTECRFGALMVGAGAAYMIHRGWRLSTWKGARPLCLIGAVFLLVEVNRTGPQYGVDEWLYNGGLTVVALAAGFVLLGVLEPSGITYRILATAPLRFVGRISYSLYLWHIPVYFAVVQEIPAPNAALQRVVISFAVSFGLSILSYQFIERPFVAYAHQTRGRHRRKGTGGETADALVGQGSRLQPRRYPL